MESHGNPRGRLGMVCVKLCERLHEEAQVDGRKTGWYRNCFGMFLFGPQDLLGDFKGIGHLAYLTLGLH